MTRLTGVSAAMLFAALLVPPIAGAQKQEPTPSWTKVSIARDGGSFQGRVRSLRAACVVDREVKLMYRPRPGRPVRARRVAEASGAGIWATTNFPRTRPFDRFARGDGPVGSPWGSFFGASLEIADQELRGPGHWAGMYWTEPFPAPHEVYAKLGQEPVVDDDYMHLVLLDRADRENANGYAIEFDDDYWDLFRIDGGTWRRLEAWFPFVHDSGFFHNGDVVGVGFDGADVVVHRRHEGVWSELGRKTDATYRPYLMYAGVEFSPQTYVRLDDVGGRPRASQRGLKAGIYFARTARQVVSTGSGPAECARARSPKITVR